LDVRPMFEQKPLIEVKKQIQIFSAY